MALSSRVIRAAAEEAKQHTARESMCGLPPQSAGLENRGFATAEEDNNLVSAVLPPPPSPLPPPAFSPISPPSSPIPFPHPGRIGSSCSPLHTRALLTSAPPCPCTPLLTAVPAPQAGGHIWVGRHVG